MLTCSVTSSYYQCVPINIQFTVVYAEVSRRSLVGRGDEVEVENFIIHLTHLRIFIIHYLGETGAQWRMGHKGSATYQFISKSCE